MKTLLSWVFNRYVLGALALLALCLIIWIVGPLVAIGDWRPLDSPTQRLVVIIALVVLHVLWQALRYWRARRVNQSVVNRLLAEAPKAPAQAGAQDPASAEITTIGERFEQALKTLKDARFRPPAAGLRGMTDRMGQRYLYQLPWYLIIGAPGSGKTTALLHSGLQFPLAAAMGASAVRGVGGTRNCDWWFTDQAVLIDTAGRYTTQDSHQSQDAAAWGGFLNLLKKSRPRQPVNGVMVTVSVTDLLTRSPAERQQQAAAIRARVQELHERFGIRFPIYLLVTKCDLMSGFMDYMGDIGKEARHDPWGFTFAMDGQQQTDIGHFGPEIDLLEQRLNDGLIDRLQAERDPERRARIYAFPQQFAGLRPALQAFTEQVFAPSSFEERPLLRGVYFVSGTQEGTPIDRMLGSISRQYRLDRTAPPVNQGTGKSYFLQRLLQEVVFQESELAGTNLKWERRRSLIAVGGYAALGLICVGTLTAWAISYTNNRQYVAEVATRVEGVRQLVQATPNRASSDALVIMPALGATRSLAQPDAAVPVQLGFGLFQGRKLDAASQQAYRRMLADALQPRLALRVEEQLRASQNDPELLYEALKVYVMLHQPERFEPDALKGYLLADWEVNLPRDVTTEQRADLEGHLAALLRQGATVSPLPQDKALLQQTRTRLAAMPLAQRVYSRIRRQGVGSDAPEFTIAKAAGPNAALVFTRQSGAALTQGVPGLFTYDGYHKGFQKTVAVATSQLSQEEPWVLGVSEAGRSNILKDSQAVGQLTDQVRRLYLNDYVRQWEGFIADIRLLPMGNLQASVQMARVLSSPDNPLLPLLRGLSKETTLLATAGKSVAEKVEDKARSAVQESRDQLLTLLKDRRTPETAPSAVRVESIVDDRFASLRFLVTGGAEGKGPAPIDGTIGLINEVYTFLSAAETAVRAGQPAPPSNVPNQVKAEAGRLPEPMRRMLETLSANSSSAVLNATKANISQSVGNDLGEFCRQATAGRYPFNRSSPNDVTPDDFARLFAPGGLFDSFFQKNLASFVDTTSRPWKSRQLGDASMGVNAATLMQFQNAAVIRDTFFRGGGTAPGFKLEFKPVEMDDSITHFTLDVDGQQVRYSHGPLIPATVQWPNTRGASQVRVALQPSGAGSGLTVDGPWALFRLFDRVQLAQAGPAERFRATFDVGGRKATFDVTASSVVNPFRLKELAEFSCPTRL